VGLVPHSKMPTVAVSLLGSIVPFNVAVLVSKFDATVVTPLGSKVTVEVSYVVAVPVSLTVIFTAGIPTTPDAVSCDINFVIKNYGTTNWNIERSNKVKWHCID